LGCGERTPISGYGITRGMSKVMSEVLLAMQDLLEARNPMLLEVNRNILGFALLNPRKIHLSKISFVLHIANCSIFSNFVTH